VQAQCSCATNYQLKYVEKLRGLGCEYVQSFMFGEPVKAGTALRLVKEQNLAKV
jgi:EAL domain-containing protein (putative c-di-GMP-specific phosphodiesterase class I)